MIARIWPPKRLLFIRYENRTFCRNGRGFQNLDLNCKDKNEAAASVHRHRVALTASSPCHNVITSSAYEPTNIRDPAKPQHGAAVEEASRQLHRELTSN